MRVVFYKCKQGQIMTKYFAVLTIIFGAYFWIGCEDPGILKADENFSKSSLRTVFVDTFSIISSTILLDSLPTSGTGQLLVGRYHDAFLGNVSASTYFQIGYQSIFAPGQISSYDSIGLVLPYSRYYYGDTTKSITINIHELSSINRLRLPLPYRTGEDNSFFVSPSQPALYNSSKFSFKPTPLTSVTVKFSPRRDSLYLRLPQSFGQSWFDLAKADALSGISTSYFSNPNSFITDFFNGIYLTTNVNSDAAIAGFRGPRAKIRLYYKRVINDILQPTYFDFPIQNVAAQFNNIQSDRSGTQIATLTRTQAISSKLTSNSTFVQSGVGLATKIEFPSVKRFFSNQNFILIDATLEVVPVQNTYSPVFRAPNTLALFTTDATNVILNRLPPFDRSNFLSANIAYDFEYGVNTKYVFPLVNYLASELANPSSQLSPIVIAPVVPSFFSEVNRVVLGDQNNSQHKIKLKIYYSYAQNK